MTVTPESRRRTRESRLRRRARRQGFIAEKLRRRDPSAIDYGRWSVARIDPARPSHRELVSPDIGWTTEELEKYLDHGHHA